MDGIILNFIKMTILAEGFESVTIFAPGSSDLSTIPNIVDVYDYDPLLPYDRKDVVFDKVEPQGELIVNLHGEKMYPTTKIYEGPQIVVVDKRPHNGNCTDASPFEGLECEEFDNHWVFYNG